MTCHYPDPGRASDWLKSNSLAIQPIRCTTWIWLVVRHRYEISALVTQMSFCEGSSGDLVKCWLFFKAIETVDSLDLSDKLSGNSGQTNW